MWSERGTRMQCFEDGDQLCIVRDDFVNLQESPAAFYSLDGELAQTVMQQGFLALSVEDLRDLYLILHKDVVIDEIARGWELA